MKLSKREAVLLGLLLVLGGVYLTNHYIFQPLRTHKQLLISENNRLTMELQVLQTRIGKYQSMEQNESQIRDDYQSMLAEVPQSPMIPSIIDYIETSARNAQVKLLSIRYKENVVVASNAARSGSENMQVIPVNFQISASGSYFDLLSFVLEIENAPRIFIINSGKMSLGKPRQSSNGITASASKDMPVSDQVMDKIVPESLTYDQSESRLDLDFSALYHNLPSNGDT